MSRDIIVPVGITSTGEFWQGESYYIAHE